MVEAGSYLGLARDHVDTDYRSMGCGRFVDLFVIGSLPYLYGEDDVGSSGHSLQSTNHPSVMKLRLDTNVLVFHNLTAVYRAYKFRKWTAFYWGGAFIDTIILSHF